MLITVESVDPGEERKLGYTPMPGFLVHFSSSIVTGWAWFVPASGDREALKGQSFGVEINQESISDFEIASPSEVQNPGVVALPQRGCFQVHGTVASVDFFNAAFNKPANERVIEIKAGDAYFHATKSACGIVNLAKDQAVTFKVNDMWLWDEAI